MRTAPGNGVRIVLDTNTALSGLIWGGPPGRLLRLSRSGAVRLVATAPLLEELRDVIGRERFSGTLLGRGFRPQDLFEAYSLLCEHVAPADIPPTILRDPDDDVVLAAAVGGSV
jgi:uncharacterized protein